MSKWYDMDSAPRDGTIVLVLDGDTVRAASYVTDESFPCWLLFAGIFSIEADEKDILGWQPLPSVKEQSDD
jgi:hypothetical protein